MRKLILTLMPVAWGFVLQGTLHSQAPSGAIAGGVSDPTGARIPGVHVTVTNKENGQKRTLVTTGDGDYSATALLPAMYEVTVQAPGFQQLARDAIVEAGTTTTVNFALGVGSSTESLTVEGASPQIHYDSHEVDGVITPPQIQGLPLNGRNFLELAKLEPGAQ